VEDLDNAFGNLVVNIDSPQPPPVPDDDTVEEEEDESEEEEEEEEEEEQEVVILPRPEDDDDDDDSEDEEEEQEVKKTKQRSDAPPTFSTRPLTAEEISSAAEIDAFCKSCLANRNTSYQNYDSDDGNYAQGQGRAVEVERIRPLLKAPRSWYEALVMKGCFQLVMNCFQTLMSVSTCAATARVGLRTGRGLLTLVHFSAHPEPFSAPDPPTYPTKRAYDELKSGRV